MFVGLHAESPFPMSRHYATACRMWSTASNCPSPLSSNRSGRATGCGYTNFEFVSASDGRAARFADANPVTTPAGTGRLPFVSIAMRNPRSWSACTRSSPNRNSGSGHVHCLCHADDGASTTRSGRCRSQLEALGCRPRSPADHHRRNRSERNRREANKRAERHNMTGRTWVATHEHLNQAPRCSDLRAAERSFLL